MQRRLLVLVLGLLVGIPAFSLHEPAILAPPPAAAQVAGCLLYGAVSGGVPGSPPPVTANSNLLVLDPNTGATSQTLGLIGAGITGLAVHPITG